MDYKLKARSLVELQLAEASHRSGFNFCHVRLLAAVHIAANLVVHLVQGQQLGTVNATALLERGNVVLLGDLSTVLLGDEPLVHLFVQIFPAAMTLRGMK